MRCARHLGGNGCERLALEIGVVAIPRDIALVLGAKAIVALANGNLGGNPESTPQTGIAILRELCLTSELARLMGRQIEAAELEKLAMVTKAAKVASFRQNDHGVDRSDAGDLAQSPVVRVVGHRSVSLLLDLIALPDEATTLGHNHTEHGD